jgi:hypothetical protein
MHRHGDICYTTCSNCNGRLLNGCITNVIVRGIGDTYDPRGCLRSDGDHADVFATLVPAGSSSPALSMYLTGTRSQRVAARVSREDNHISEHAEKHNLIGGVDAPLTLDSAASPTAILALARTRVGHAFAPACGLWAPASVLRPWQPGVPRCGRLAARAATTATRAWARFYWRCCMSMPA